jgi:hypothetical protein
MDRLLTTREAADILRVDRSFFNEFSRLGDPMPHRPPMIRVGKHLRIRELDLENYLDANTFLDEVKIEMEETILIIPRRAKKL